MCCWLMLITGILYDSQLLEIQIGQGGRSLKNEKKLTAIRTALYAAKADCNRAFQRITAQGRQRSSRTSGNAGNDAGLRVGPKPDSDAWSLSERPAN
jgi:hypothetical protein